MSKIIGITVGTNISPQTITEKLNPVLSVNDVTPDEGGNAKIDLSDYAQKEELPNKTSQLENDSGYLTQHQSLAGYATEQFVNAAIGAIPTPDVSGQISTHNTATDSHNDIRLIISGLTERLNALANSDDTTLDQMAEVVAYIKDNRELIEQVTTDKVSVSDIINDLATNVADKPLSAAQGVALKNQLDKKSNSGHNHSAAAITQGTLNIARFPTVTIAKGGTGATDVETARANLGVPSVEEMNAAFNAFKTEEWTFTLEDGSTVTKAVYVG